MQDRNAEGFSALSELAAQGHGFALLDFFADRLEVQQREAGVRHDLIDAVFALGGEDDLVRLLARVKALQAFMATEDGTNLLAGYKRAANILKQAGEVSGTAAATPPTEADAALLAALDAAEPAASAAVAEERFTDAMAALASLRAPIDAFFEGAMVNDPDRRSATIASACCRALPARCMASPISRRSRADVTAAASLYRNEVN